MLNNIAAFTGVPVLAPSPVAGYNLWLDAADTATITLSGSAVTQWTDKSANAYTFTQGTAAQQPVSGTQSQNGKNVMVFATNDSLAATSAASVWKFLSDGSTYTVMIACKTTDASAQQIVLSTYSGSGNSVGVTILTEVSNNFKHSVLRAVSGSPALDNNSANFVLTTAFTYMSVLGDPGNATAANRSDMRAKQGSAIKNNTVTFTPSTSNPFQSLRVGDYIQAGAVGWIGQIGEILIYPSLLSSGDLLLNQQYLANKWGV
jgi:hypothetical protein